MTTKDLFAFKSIGNNPVSPDFNQYMDIQQSINLHLLERFSANEIELAQPATVFGA